MWHAHVCNHLHAYAQVLRANLSPWEETNAAELQAERMLGLREQGSKGAAGGERVEHGLALAEARRAGREIHESVELLAFRMLHNTTASAQEGHERSAHGYQSNTTVSP